MNQQLRDRLEVLRGEFAVNDPSGRPFRFFHCPILGVDEDVELQKGHIINEAFADSDRAWVPQRKDVDNFYGTHFEAEFEQLQFKDAGLTPAEVFADRVLSHKLRPGFYLDGRRVEHTHRQGASSAGLTPIDLFHGDGDPIPMALKMSPDDVIASAGRSWEIGYERDLRLPTLVSAIKAAHLTAFHLLGYRYALRTAGLLIGPDLLGKFFREARDLPRAEVRVRARTHFGEFAHAVRPVLGFEGCDFRGTVSDRHFFFCRGSSDAFWGLIFFLRTAQIMHAVLLPNGSSPDTVATYLDFLHNDNETIHVSTGRFAAAAGHFEINPNALPMRWPKTDGPFDPIDRAEPTAGGDPPRSLADAR